MLCSLADGMSVVMTGDLHCDVVVAYSRMTSPSEFSMLARRLLAWIAGKPSGGNVWFGFDVDDDDS